MRAQPNDHGRQPSDRFDCSTDDGADRAAGDYWFGSSFIGSQGESGFIDLVRELKEQGIGNKVIADTFGLALRTYHDCVRRLQESATYGGRSLWEVVLEYVQERGAVLPTDVFTRFRNDDGPTSRGP